MLVVSFKQMILHFIRNLIAVYSNLLKIINVEFINGTLNFAFGLRLQTNGFDKQIKLHKTLVALTNKFGYFCLLGI